VLVLPQDFDEPVVIEIARVIDGRVTELYRLEPKMPRR
jgi:hypothetical protein